MGTVRTLILLKFNLSGKKISAFSMAKYLLYIYFHAYVHLGIIEVQ